MTTTTTTTTTKVTTTDEVALLEESAEALIVAFNNAKAAIKALEGEKAEAEKALRELLGDAEVGTINGVERVRIVSRVTSKIDRDLLKTGFPEAFEATYVQTPYTVLQTK
jgi:predicted phage-related endonuclease